MARRPAAQGEVSPVTEESFDALVSTLERTDHTAGLKKLTRLFHYTDSDGLYGIVTSNALRATHYKFLNDRTELRWANTVARLVLEKKREKARIRSTKTLLDNILDNIDEGNSPFDAYLTCLSSKRDSLSQWRAYGGGIGFCLGLNIAPLKSLNLKNVEHHFFVKVIYDRKVQEALITDAFDKVARLLRSAEEQGSKDAPRWAQSTFEAMLAILSVYFKHPAFEDEAEWRLVLLQPSGDLKFRSSAGKGIIPYLDINFGTEDVGKIPLVSVRLGPGADRSRAGLGVRRLVRQFGFNKCMIYYASAPFAPV